MDIKQGRQIWTNIHKVSKDSQKDQSGEEGIDIRYVRKVSPNPNFGVGGHLDFGVGGHLNLGGIICYVFK